MSLPSALRTKALHFTVTAASATDGEAAVTISTGNSDRHRDKVMPHGITLDNYKKNPVVLYGHDYHALPVGTCTQIESTADGLKASWKWLAGDPFADRVKNAWDQGMLRAASIGFIPMKWAYDEERRGFDYTECELLEFSIVSVPANAEAVRQLQAAGLPVNESDERYIALAAEVADLKALLTKTTDETVDTDYFDIDDEDDDGLDLTADEVRAAMTLALTEPVAKALDAALTYARGRID